MKKIVLVALAVLLLGIPLSAGAVDTELHGIIWHTLNSSRGVGAYSGTVIDDFNRDPITVGGVTYNYGPARTYSYTRNIPNITLKFSDDLKYYIQLDTLVNVWGGEGGCGTYIHPTTGLATFVSGGSCAGVSTRGASGYGFGAYAYSGSADVHVRNTYADFRIPSTPARLKVGLQNVADGANLTIWTADVPGISLTTPVGKGNLYALWAKIGEGAIPTGAVGSNGTGNEFVTDDAAAYAVKYSYPVTPTITLTPQWYYAHGDGKHACGVCGDGIGFKGKNIHWLGANMKGNFKTGVGPVALDMNLFGATGKYEEVATVKGTYGGMLFETRASLDLGMVKPGITFLYTSGDSNLASTDTKRNMWPSINAYYLGSSPLFVGASGLQYYTTVTNSASGQMHNWRPGIPGTANGITMFQVNAALKPLKSLTVIPAIGVYRASEDWAGYTIPGTGAVIPATADSKDMGTGYEVVFDYYIYKNLRLYTTIAGFQPGAFYQYVDGDADDADSAFMFKSFLALIF